eukprot:g44688.t1
MVLLNAEGKGKRVQLFNPGCHRHLSYSCPNPLLQDNSSQPVSTFPHEEEPKPVFEKKPLIWEEDLQLYSKFIDRTVINQQLWSMFLPMAE